MTTAGLTGALRETLTLFEAGSDSGTPLTTSEVAGELDVGRRSAYDRLDRLVDRGHLETKQVGARGRIWWLPVDATAAETVDGADDTAESFRALVDAVEEYAIFRLDPEGRVATWNAGAARIKGYDESEILGEHVSTFYTERDAAERVPERNLATAARDGWVEDEGWRVRDDGSRFWASMTITAIQDEDDGLEGYVKVTRDMTERRTLEERLRRQRDELESELEAVFERVDDAFLAIDDGWEVTYLNDGAAELVDRSIGEALGTSIWEILPAIDAERPRTRIEAALDAGESRELDVHAESLGRWLEVRAYPAEGGLSVYLRDVTGRKEREQDLERYEAVVETVDDGIYVARDGQFAMVNEEYADMVGYSREELQGAEVSLVVSDDTAETAAAYQDELLAGERDTARVEADVQRPDGETVRAEATFALLPTDDERVERVGVVRDVSERVERERELERQREHLAALDDLNAVVREITTDVIEQSTREEIERTLCERLADSDSYELAWIGELDAATKTVRQRVSAGAGGALDDLTVPLDDPGTRDGPIARTVDALEMQVAGGIAEDPAYDAVRDRVGPAVDRPAAAIPIAHEGHCYGVLYLVSARENAFAAEEREVVAQLGTAVGHAIAALDRKRALMSDEVVELEFRLTSILDTFGAEGPGGEQASLGRSVSVGNGRYLVYGTANPEGVELIRDLRERAPHWEDVSVLEERGDDVRLQVQLSEPPILAAVASRGGSVQDFDIENGEIYMQIHLAPGAEVREVIDVITETYPGAEMVSRRQIARNADQQARYADDTVVDRLTDRQLVALKAAYNAGFFEQPRVNSGEEIAERLDVTAATFHQHLRKAEETLIEGVLEEPPVE